jgi:AcrR family transcriptional regulator
VPPRKTAAGEPTTRDRLIAAAAEVFAEEGVAAARLEDIAARAGFTRGAFYWNFADKQELLYAVLDAVATSALDAAPESPTALDDLIARAVRSRTFRTRGRMLWLVAIEFALHGARHSARVRAGLVKRYHQVEQMRERLVRARLADVNVSEDQLALLGRILQALEDGFMLQWIVDEKHFPIEDWPRAQKWILDALQRASA